MDKLQKYCPKCKVKKSRSDFYSDRGRKDGITVYCANCHELTNKSIRQELRQKVINKLGGKCRCGYSDIRALQIDHVMGGGGKERKLMNSPGKYMRHVLTDLTGKYQLLCANCNCIKRIEEKEFAPHIKRN